MSRNYKYWNQEFPHFISFATVGWIDVFTRRDYFNVMVDCINHTIDEKGLIVYGWCIMTNHVHMIIGTKGIKQQDLVRDLKSFSAKRLLKTIQVNPQESRKQWLLELFKRAGNINSSNRVYQFWQHHNQPLEITNKRKMDTFLTYIHRNPVVSGIVGYEQHYQYSSAIDYCGGAGLVKIKNILQ